MVRWGAMTSKMSTFQISPHKGLRKGGSSKDLYLRIAREARQKFLVTGEPNYPWGENVLDRG